MRISDYSSLVYAIEDMIFGLVMDCRILRASATE